MADKTTNYNLTKPSADDFYDVVVQNGNMDIIDAELIKLENGKAPSGHGLGKQAVGIVNETMLKALSRGGGFYQIQNAADTPSTSQSWISLLQLSRGTDTDNSSGFQIAAFDYSKNNPQMWFRTIISNEPSAWNELIHTGNFSKQTAFAKIKAGSYVGTGTYGSTNPNVLTFGFTPKLLLVYCPSGVLGDYYEATFLHGCPNALVKSFRLGTISNYSASNVYATWSSNSVSWYYSNDVEQLNKQNVTYYYVAIG